MEKIDYLLNRILRRGKETPQKAAVIFKDETLTYAALSGKAAGMALSLRELGVEKGAVVCISAVSKPETVAGYLAILCAGGTAVFLDKNGTPGSLADIYKESGAMLMLTDKPLKENAAAVNAVSLKNMYKAAGEKLSQEHCRDLEGAFAVSPDPEEISEILYTTGSTGRPKGVMLSYRAVYNIFSNTITGTGIRDDDVLLMPLPLNHSFALRVLRAVLYKGGTVVLQNGFTFAKEAENNINRFNCTAMAAVPASYEVMKSQMQDFLPGILGKLRYMEFGSGSLSIRQRKEICRLLPEVKIYNTWGSSETGGVLFCDVQKAVLSGKKAGTLGRPVKGTEVCFLDAQGKSTAADREHPGRMALKGGMQMSGYQGRPDLTGETLKDGWLITGDMAYADADGDVFMLGRADDIINVGGEKVSPIEVEEAAGEYEFIRDLACIGVNDPEGVLGEVPVLFMETAPGYKEEELRKFLQGRIEKYKIPHIYVEVEKIPRNRMQKKDYRAVRKLWEERGAEDLMNPVIKAILGRRSIRRFREEPVPENILKMLVKAGIYAPSGHNMQSWKFTVITDTDRLEELKEAAKETAILRKVSFYGWENPRALILVSNDSRNPDGCQDASCAAENIMLAAYSFGLGSTWLNPLMTLRDAEPAKSVLDGLGVPKNHTVWAAVALGYPAAEGSLLAKKKDVVSYI